MGDEPTTTLTVAKLKALCVLNDVSASGKKAELLARLLEAGVDKETLGIEVFDEETSTFQPVADGDEDEPIMLSLEDEETMSTVPLPSETSTASDDEVLDAEVLEADLIDLAEETDRTAATSVPLPKTSASSTPLPKKTDDAKALTLLEMVRRPQAVAVLITLVLLGAGGWYYVNNQLEPFTADSLRYGDTMGYMITDGTFLASEEYVELVTDRLEDPPNYCRISLDFQGQSTASITNGGSMELSLIHI